MHILSQYRHCEMCVIKISCRKEINDLDMTLYKNKKERQKYNFGPHILGQFSFWSLLFRSEERRVGKECVP